MSHTTASVKDSESLILTYDPKTHDSIVEEGDEFVTVSILPKAVKADEYQES